MTIEITSNQKDLLLTILNHTRDPTKKCNLYQLGKKLDKDTRNIKRTLQNLTQRIENVSSSTTI